MKAIINENFIDLSLSSNNKETVISYMSDLLLKAGRITDKHTYVSAVMEREALESTAVGFEVGIPHGKSEAVNVPTVFFGRSDEGIKWSDEDELVKLVFLLAIPNEAASNQHLKILAALSRKLMDEDFIGMLKTGRSKEEILKGLEETLESVTA